MLLEILFIYVIYLSLLVLAVYYIDLFQIKDQYTKEELKDLKPFVKTFWNKITNNYAFPVLLVILLSSSIIGTSLLMIFDHWLINSALLSMVTFFGLPLIKKYFEQSQVSSSEDYSDTFVNIFVRYNDIFILGFCTGTGTALMYNWASMPSFIFIWLAPNIIAVTILVIIAIKNALK